MKKNKLATGSKSNLRLYSFLSRFPHRKSYKGKIMLVAFLGTHVPLLSLLIYFVVSTSFTFEIRVRVIVIALMATLVGTALTLYALNHLLAPITLTFLALREYLSQKTLPNLPTEFTDEVGVLMADTSHTIRKLDEVIQYMVNYDNLTGLPNQVLFRDRVQEALLQAQSNNQLLAVVVLSLDRFKAINNTLGHSAGDLLLRSSAQRLASCIRDTDVLSRLGSDKFAVLQPKVTSLDDVTTLSEKILNILSKSFLLDGNEVRTGASIGISTYLCDRT